MSDSGSSARHPWLGLAIRVVVSVAVLTFLFKEHRFTSAILPKIGQLLENVGWTATGVACAGLSAWLTAVRWWLLLKPQVPGVSLSTVVRETFVSLFFNITSLGVAGGDAYKVIALSRRHPAHKIPVAVTVMLDHVVGFFAVAVLFLSCAAWSATRWSGYGEKVHAVLGGFTILLGASALFLLINIVLCSPPVRAWGEPRLPWLLQRPRMQRLAHAFDGLRRHWRSSLAATGVSALMTLLFFLSFYCGVRAVGGEAPLIDVLVAMPIVDMVTALPISVSGLGVREKTFEALLSAFSALPEATAISASLAGWLFSLVWGLFGGLLFLRRATPPTPDASRSERSS
jgi:uncharacterized membrane protein YbhN (UPF0104 family)